MTVTETNGSDFRDHGKSTLVVHIILASFELLQLIIFRLYGVPNQSKAQSKARVFTYSIKSFSVPDHKLCAPS